MSSVSYRQVVVPPYPLLAEFGGVGGTLLQLSTDWLTWNIGSSMLLADMVVVMYELV